jgi:hypothetical protein
MKKGIFKTLTLLAAAFAVAGFTSTRTADLCDGFLPPNNMKIPVGATHQWAFSDVATGGLTEEQFNSVIDRFERLYSDEISKLGGTLKVNRLWTDETVNASANQQGTTWNVNMYGGLARHPAITVEGFALVICHEGGHHLGGAPKIGDLWGGRSWATNEGGADYFATLKCLRRFFAEDDNATIVGKAQIDPLAKERCESEFTNVNDQLLCKRSSLAGNSVALLFMDLRKETTPPGFGTPDPKVVTETNDAHPATQCRMDTYFAGAVCHVDASVANSNTDYRQGSCVQPQDNFGWRPLCWFKP